MNALKALFAAERIRQDALAAVVAARMAVIEAVDILSVANAAYGEALQVYAGMRSKEKGGLTN